MSLQKIRIFPTGKQMKLNFNINNELKEDFEITKINLIRKIPEIRLESLLVSLLNSKHAKHHSSSNINSNSNEYNNDNNSQIKSNNSVLAKFSDVFSFKKSTEFLLPILFSCSMPYSGSLGTVEIFYTTKGLEEFNSNLYNKISFVIPEYNMKAFDIDLGYSIPKNIKNKENFDLKILIKNNSEEAKRIMLLIDNTQYFIINGRVKERIILNSKENLEKSFNLIPLNFGKLKLPAFKIMEFPYESNNFENKIYSIYYLPDNVHIN